MKRLPMRKIRDVLRLSAEGFSTRQMASSLAIGRTTLQGYLDRAHEAGLTRKIHEKGTADLLFVLRFNWLNRSKPGDRR